MVKIRPLIQVLGKIIKLPSNTYLDPETLGSGTPSATNVLKGDGTWGTVPSTSVSVSIVQKTSNYTVLSSDDIIECTSGTFTVALPTAVGIAAKRYEITNSGSGVITVNPFGSQTINGELTIELLQYDSMQIVSNGSNWIII